MPSASTSESSSEINQSNPQEIPEASAILFEASSSATTMADSRPLTEFELFPKLPIELRCKIWKEAAYTAPPRVVSIKCEPVFFERAKNQFRGRKLTSNTPVPFLLHVSKESRAEALKLYQLSLASHHSDPTIYVNFGRDTLYLEQLTHPHLDQGRNVWGPNRTWFSISTMISHLRKKDFDQVRYLSISSGPAGEPEALESHLAMLQELPHVVEVAFILNQADGTGESRHLELRDWVSLPHMSSFSPDYRPWELERQIEFIRPMHEENYDNDSKEDKATGKDDHAEEHSRLPRQPQIVYKTLAPLDWDGPFIERSPFDVQTPRTPTPHRYASTSPYYAGISPHSNPEGSSQFNPSSSQFGATSSPSYCPASPNWALASPGYAAVSPENRPTTPQYGSPQYSAPDYGTNSRKFSP